MEYEKRLSQTKWCGADDTPSHSRAAARTRARSSWSRRRRPSPRWGTITLPVTLTHAGAQPHEGPAPHQRRRPPPVPQTTSIAQSLQCGRALAEHEAAAARAAERIRVLERGNAELLVNASKSSKVPVRVDVTGSRAAARSRVLHQGGRGAAAGVRPRAAMHALTAAGPLSRPSPSRRRAITTVCGACDGRRKLPSPAGVVRKGSKKASIDIITLITENAAAKHSTGTSVSAAASR